MDSQEIRGHAEVGRNVYFPISHPAWLQFGPDYIPLSKASTPVLKSQVTLGRCSLTRFLRPRGDRMLPLLVPESFASFGITLTLCK